MSPSEQDYIDYLNDRISNAPTERERDEAISEAIAAGLELQYEDETAASAEEEKQALAEERQERIVEQLVRAEEIAGRPLTEKEEKDLVSKVPSVGEVPDLTKEGEALRDRPLDEEWMAEDLASNPDWQEMQAERKERESSGGFPVEDPSAPEEEVPAAEPEGAI